MDGGGGVVRDDGREPGDVSADDHRPRRFGRCREAEGCYGAGSPVPARDHAERVVKENAGSRAISAIPELADGQPVWMITLLRADAVQIVSQKLDWRPWP